MRIEITKKMLEDLRACSSGIDMFWKLYPSGVYQAEWTLEEQIKIIKSPLRKYFAWGVYQKLFCPQHPTNGCHGRLKVCFAKILVLGSNL